MDLAKKYYNNDETVTAISSASAKVRLFPTGTYGDGFYTEPPKKTNLNFNEYAIYNLIGSGIPVTQKETIPTSGGFYAASKRRHYLLDYTSLSDLYKIPSEDVVFKYLGLNRNLIYFLTKAKYEINKLVPTKSISLEIFKDIEEGWEKLSINIDYDTDDLDAIIEYEDILLENWLIPQSSLTKNKVFLTSC